MSCFECIRVFATWAFSCVSQCDMFIKCESGCAYHGITDLVTNTLMKVQHVAVSEKQCSQLLCTTYGDLDLEIRTLSANVTESAA